MPAPADLHTFYSRRTVLVTGGAGFIGSHLVHGLVAHGATVRILDDLSSGKRANLADLGDTITFTEASILDRDALDATLPGCDLIFHEAALASVPASVENPRAFHEVNTDGTFELLEAARRHNVHRIVFASSSAVYGDQPELPKRESMLPDPLSPYAQQKLTDESLLRVWALNYGLTAICLRYFNVFGPLQLADSAYAAVVASFCNRLLSGLPPRIFGDGSASRDFTYIDDVVTANLLAGAVDWDAGRSPAVPNHLRGGILNIARGERITVLELAQILTTLARLDAQPEFAPPRPGDVQHSLADISRARTILGYQPRVSVAEGLSKTLEWYRSLRT